MPLSVGVDSVSHGAPDLTEHRQTPLLERLQAWADKKVGDPLPNEWGPKLTADLCEAIAELKKHSSWPRFQSRTVIDSPALVVDDNGVAWWVSPGPGMPRIAKMKVPDDAP